MTNLSQNLINKFKTVNWSVPVLEIDLLVLASYFVPGISSWYYLQVIAEYRPLLSGVLRWDLNTVSNVGW